MVVNFSNISGNGSSCLLLVYKSFGKATILNVEIFSNVMGVARTSILFKSATRQFSLNNRIIGDLSTVHT